MPVFPFGLYVFFLLLSPPNLGEKAGIVPDSQLFNILESWENELIVEEKKFRKEVELLHRKLRQLYPARGTRSTLAQPADLTLQAFFSIHFLRDSIWRLTEMHDQVKTLVRYQKGLEIIRLLYEKILGLDHHFTSLKTYHKVAALSNPHNYPEFHEAKSLIDASLNKKSAVDLPEMLDANPYFSAAYSVVASVIGSGNTASRTKNLEEVACILDFSVRMNSQLLLIYYETEFLKESNISLKKSCQLLFEDYVKPLGYRKSLAECRQQDDWEDVYTLLNAYATKIKSSPITDPPVDTETSSALTVELEFAVNRLIYLINQYTDFVSQGERYYHKFQIITNSYSNEAVCLGKLPAPYEDLKKDISFSISKFNESYNLVALKGSKLKELLYGTIH